MTIFDKLLEKKDLTIYLDLRIKFLKNTLTKVGTNERIKIEERIHNRLKELRLLKEIFEQNRLKNAADKYWSMRPINIGEAFYRESAQP